MYKEEKVYTRRIVQKGGEQRYFISFNGVTGGIVEIEVEADVYNAIREHELIEARIARSDRLHIERLSLTDEEIDLRASCSHETTEKKVLLNLCLHEIAEAIDSMSATQRRRFLLHRISGKTLKSIAAKEGAPFSTVQYCVKQAEKKLCEIYKKFSD